VHGVDPTLPLHAAMPMVDVISGTVAPRRVNTLLIGTFAALAVCLALIGVYGVLAHSTAQRTREIGIRMALGAAPGQVRTAVVRQGLTLVGLGTVLGIVAALATTPLLESLLYEVAPQDPTTIGAVVLLFAVVGAVASYVPARRASAIDPLEALRQE
jgi:ABC-type antimicrobial peptide transport system permease subunit